MLMCIIMNQNNTIVIEDLFDQVCKQNFAPQKLWKKISGSGT